jgi:DNA polymerase III subunit epsilon
LSATVPFQQVLRVLKRFGLTDQRYRFLFDPEPANEVVSLDCETTGFDPQRDEIISIAAIRITGTRILTSSAFRALVRPETHVSPESIRIHQLRQQDVAWARPMADILPELLHFIGSRALVGYWVDFDVRMLNKYTIAMLDTWLPNRRIDVSRLYYDRKYGNAPPGSRIDLRYGAIRDDLKLPGRPQHDAFEDALGAAEMYLILDDMERRDVRLARDRLQLHAQFSVT